MEEQARLRQRLSRSGAREKVAHNLARIPDADLNVVEGMQAGLFVKGFAFDKKGADAVKRGLVFLFSQLVKGFKHGPVKVTSAEMFAFVLSGRQARSSANIQVGFVRGSDEVKMFGVNQV